MKEYEFPNPSDRSWKITFGTLGREARRLYENTDYALVAGTLPGAFELSNSLRGMDKFLVDLITNRKFAEKLME